MDKDAERGKRKLLLLFINFKINSKSDKFISGVHNITRIHFKK